MQLDHIRPPTTADVLEFESWPKEKQELAFRVVAGNPRRGGFYKKIGPETPKDE